MDKSGHNLVFLIFADHISVSVNFQSLYVLKLTIESYNQRTISSLQKEDRNFRVELVPICDETVATLLAQCSPRKFCHTLRC